MYSDRLRGWSFKHAWLWRIQNKTQPDVAVKCFLNGFLFLFMRLLPLCNIRNWSRNPMTGHIWNLPRSCCYIRALAPTAVVLHSCLPYCGCDIHCTRSMSHNFQIWLCFHIQDLRRRFCFQHNTVAWGIPNFPRSCWHTVLWAIILVPKCRKCLFQSLAKIWDEFWRIHSLVTIRYSN